MVYLAKSNTVEFNGTIYSLDQHGFLFPADQWDENFALGMAMQCGIYDGLTDKHWAFINYLRKKFLDEETVPVVVLACADNKLRLMDFRALFPTGYHRGACRIAGINYEFMFKVNHWLTFENPPLPVTKFKITKTGFLVHFNQWKEEFAKSLVAEWKLVHGFSERHRQVIGFLRKYYEQNENIPTIFETCEVNNLTLEEMKSLFPEGYRRGACRAAGLPFFP